MDNPNFSFEPVIYDGVPLNPVVISDQVLINNHYRYVESIKTLYTDSLYCPENYTIMKKEELESIISYLGDNAYTTFLDENSLDMSEGIYYVTNTKGNGDYNKIFMILKDNQIKFEDFDPMSYIMDFTSNQKFHTICKLTIPKVEIVFPDNNKDFDYNTQIKIKVNYNQFFIAYLWKINDKLYTEEEVNLSLNESGVNNIEFWGKYVTGKMEYLCDIFFVSEEKVPDGQDYNTSNIKKITTQFKMFYNNALHFTTSNCPAAPREDGGYYIAVANTELYLHIL